MQVTRAGTTGRENNGRLINNYRVDNKVGEGSFGTVYRAVHVHTAVVYAMKVISRVVASLVVLTTARCDVSLIVTVVHIQLSSHVRRYFVKRRISQSRHGGSRSDAA